MDHIFASKARNRPRLGSIGSPPHRLSIDPLPARIHPLFIALRLHLASSPPTPPHQCQQLLPGVCSGTRLLSGLHSLAEESPTLVAPTHCCHPSHFPQHHLIFTKIPSTHLSSVQVQFWGSWLILHPLRAPLDTLSASDHI